MTRSTSVPSKFNRAFDSYGVSQFLCAVTSGALANLGPQRSLGLKCAYISCVTTHSETKRSWSQTDLSFVLLYLVQQTLTGSACEFSEP